MVKEGLDVHLVWGGTRLPGFDFSGLTLHELTPVRTSDAAFNQLLHADGTQFSKQDEEARKHQLLDLYRALKPDVLISEAFPFGRRQMQFELLPLFELAANSSPRPMIVSSIRDIMQEDRKEKRVRESNDLVEKYFDLVLVHGDPNLIRIEETLQGVEEFGSKIRYTGLVTPERFDDEPTPGQQTNVLVSVGGGAFGRRLLETALQAHSLCKSRQDNWLVTTGTELNDQAFDSIVSNAPKGVKIVRYIPNMLEMLKATQVSVSHAGYNTVGDIMQAGCRSVLFPYTGGRETEQLRRAQMLDELGIVTCIHPDAFSAETLAQAIDETLAQKPKSHSLDLDGARGSATAIVSALEDFQK
jgi:predicted glycosyltransferase